MSDITIRNIGMHEDSYCSQERRSPALIRNIEEGVKAIEEILKKNILCWHDVKDINQIYQTIDLLERQIDRISPCNSQQALEKIIRKIKNIVENCDAGNLISLYHLQAFSDKDLRINQCFSNLRVKWVKGLANIEDLAVHLPVCDSTTRFEQDILDLIGKDQNEVVTNNLNQKKRKLKNYEKTKQDIEIKKQELKENRKKNPHPNPPYFDELLDSGYIYLYDHLNRMRALPNRNERRAEIEKMTFSTLSHTVLEMREAVIQKVESSIPTDRRNILFLLGGSGAGKSTALCFLRGDKMLLKDFCYESQSDKSGLIGHERATSCTFLPIIQVIDDVVIVDFPGFDDTNGPIISLGIECALKALIKKYSPKILVLEAITNNENRFAAAAQLGLRLSRLLANKERCILGITKYSKDPDFGRIRAIEEEQRKEQLAPTDQEKRLVGVIEFLSSQNMLELMPEKEQELAKIRQERESKLQLPLPKTTSMIESAERIKEKEDELLKQIGLSQIIRFQNLEDANQLSSCLADLSNFSAEASTNVCSDQRVEPEDRELLKTLFVNDLKKELEAERDYQVSFKDFKDFEQNVLESSLIKTIFSQSNPEIGEFLHLPEIDPNIVREYDRDIVGNCIKKYMRSVIRELNVSLFNRILKEMGERVPRAKIASLEKSLDRLQKYVMGLLGALSEDPAQAEKEWNRIQIECAETVTLAVEKRFNLPAWATVCLCIPLGIPYGVFALFKRNAQTEAAQREDEKTIDTFCKVLDQIYEVLQRLKDIEKIIEKQDAIDQAFKSVPISMDSIDALEMSLQRKINKVREIYGGEDWDKRVELLADKISLTHFDPKNAAHLSCIPAYAYYLIEPGLSCTSKVKTTIDIIETAMLIARQNLREAREEEETFASVPLLPEPLLRRRIRSMRNEEYEGAWMVRPELLEKQEKAYIAEWEKQEKIHRAELKKIATEEVRVLTRTREKAMTGLIFNLFIGKRSNYSIRDIDGKDKLIRLEKEPIVFIKEENIGIIGLGRLPELAQESIRSHYEHLPLSRTLSGAAILKTYEKIHLK